MKLHDNPLLEGVLLADGLDHAFTGLWYPQFNDRTEEIEVGVATYSVSKIIEGYVKDGMTEEEAHEFFQFNVEGAYVGEKTPIFIDDFSWKIGNGIKDMG